MRDMRINKLTEKTETKKTVFLNGMRGFVIILLAAFFILTGKTFGEYKKASLTEVSVSGIRELVMMDNEEEAVQKFRARYSELDSIYVYFANEHEGKNQGMIRFSIEETDGTNVVTKTIPASEIANKDFTKIRIGKKLRPGTVYRLVVSGENLTPGKSPILYREKYSFGGNGVVTAECSYKGKMEVRYEYPAQIRIQLFLILISILGLMLLVEKEKKPVVQKKRKMAEEILEQVIFWLTPLISFIMVEHFTYNSIFDIYRLGTVMNLVLYYCLYFLGYVISNHRKMNVVGCLFISYLLGAANYFVLSFRGTPILPTDIASFTTAMNVAENYTYSLNSAFFTNALVFFFISILYCRCQSERRPLMLKKRMAVLAGIFCVSLCVGGLIGQEEWLAAGKVKADIWNQKRGYSRDGALASFFLNTKYLYTEKPDGYSVDRVMEIAETYIWNEGETASLNGMSSRTHLKKTEEKTKQSQKKKPNIIMIMNEAFSDLSVIHPIETNEDYMPFIHKLKKNTIKGNLFVSIFGAGTCNSEFEVLTGNSMAFLPSGSIGYTQFVKDEMPNMTQTLKAQGYKGNIAVHPYLADGWNRPVVYPLFGFERFLSQDDFENPQMIRKYISDKEDYKKLITLYEESKNENPDDPCFLFTVTMQNHGGFSKDYGNLDKEIQITDEQLQDEEAEQYLSLIKKSDTAFKMLVEYFKKQDDPTMIVMWGDHQPSIHDEFYQKLYGKDMGSLTTEELQKKYQVPFVIWANYDIEEEEGKSLSANYLGSYVLEKAGLMMTPYQRYLLDLSKKIPVFNSVGYIGDDGCYYEQGEESEYSSYISNYNILQYNNVIDYKNRYENFFSSDNLVD